MKSIPEISVVMSVYNGLPFLEKSIQSILNQTFKDFEFIIIEDCSTDGSKEIIKKYSFQDPRIVCIYNETNLGHISLGYNMAKGVELARGKYIARMDSDDIAFPNRFTIQKEFLDNNPLIDIAGSWAIDIDDKDGQLGYRKYPEKNKDIVRVLWSNPLIHPTVMFRRDSILNIGNYSINSGRRDDYELWFRAAAKGLKFANIPEYLLYYRFFDNFYNKNNFKVVIKQTQIGLKGCWMIKAKPLSYLAVLAPLCRSILPGKLKSYFHYLMFKIDPRKQR